MKNKKNNICETYGESKQRLEKKAAKDSCLGFLHRRLCETYEESARRLEKTSKVS